MSAQRKEFKTINLQTKIYNQKYIQLSWDSYEGLQYHAYIIYKKVGKDLIAVDSVPASISKYTNMTLDPQGQYVVGIKLPKQINPKNNKLKAESGPFSLAMSNIAEAETSIADNNIFDTNTISISVKGKSIEIQSNEIMQHANINISTIEGKVIANQNVDNSNSTSIDISKYPHGIYIVTVIEGSSLVSNKITIE
jgi:hypothetical protein